MSKCHFRPPSGAGVRSKPGQPQGTSPVGDTFPAEGEEGTLWRQCPHGGSQTSPREGSTCSGAEGASPTRGVGGRANTTSRA